MVLTSVPPSEATILRGESAVLMSGKQARESKPLVCTHGSNLEPTEGVLNEGEPKP